MRILFLSRWFPNPPDNGSKIRIYNLLRELSREHVVSLVALADPDVIDVHLPAEVASSVRVLPYRAFDRRGSRAIAGFLSSQPRFLVATHREDVRAAIRDVVRQARPDLVIASQLDMLPYALEVEAPRVLEEIEISAYLEERAPPRPLRHRVRATLTWLKLARCLRQVLPKFAACTVVSSQEQVSLHRAAPAYDAVHVVPNAIDLAAYGTHYGSVDPNALVFAGSVTYPPNMDAARFFVDDILPVVRSRVPTARLQITGRLSADAEQLAAQSSGVQFTGHLVDVRPTIARSAVAVVPLRAGGGTRLKILEAMALGTPVVSTTKGAEGLSVTDGTNVLLANTPSAFGDAVVRLIQDPALRQRIGVGGRKLVAAHYDWATVGRQVRGLVAHATARSSVGMTA